LLTLWVTPVEILGQPCLAKSNEQLT